MKANTSSLTDPERVKAELEAISCSDDEAGSIIASTLISCVRDRTASSAYGYAMSKFSDLPRIPAEFIFTDKVANCVEERLRALSGSEALDSPLYSGEGDFLSQLARLLIICNETIANEEFENQVNDRIAKLGLEIEYANDPKKIIGHIRNAILHSRFKFAVEQDWEQTRLILLDCIVSKDIVRKGEVKVITAKITMTYDQLQQIIVELEDLCKSYLKSIGYIPC